MRLLAALLQLETFCTVRSGSAYSKALKCSFNFKHVSNPGKVSGITDFQN